VPKLSDVVADIKDRWKVENWKHFLPALTRAMRDVASGYEQFATAPAIQSFDEDPSHLRDMAFSAACSRVRRVKD
jgi:hypothetical protein